LREFFLATNILCAIMEETSLLIAIEVDVGVLFSVS